MGNKDTEFFNGFERKVPGIDKINSFSYNEDLWKNLLSNDELRNLLCINTKDDSPLNKKKAGSLSWGADGILILNMNKDKDKEAKDYKADWLKTLTGRQLNYSRLEEIFKKFIGAVPNEAVDMGPLSMYFQAIRETAQYLQEVLRRCANASGDKQRELLAAGLYSMICLVMQNGKYYKKGTYPILCRRPPNQYDPLADWEPPVIIKNDRPKITIPPEIPLYQDSYDFWGVLRSRFPEPEERKNPADTEGELWDVMREAIKPAQIHRTRAHFSSEIFIPVIDSTDACSGSFWVNDIPVFHDGQWHSGIKLHGLPWIETDAECIGKPALFETETFSDRRIFEGLYLSVDKERDRLVYDFFIFTDEHFQFFCNGIHPNWQIKLIHLNENGYLRDPEIERSLAAYTIESVSAQSVPQPREKTFVGKFDHNLLRFLFLNPDTMEEIPKRVWLDPSSGEYKISVTLPCPSRLIVSHYGRFQQEEVWAKQLALEGYLLGLHGFDVDTKKAERLMDDGWRNGDKYMAFEYGALTKQNGFPIAATYPLQFAADRGIPGAKFLLAEVLKEMGSTEKARALIDDLWQQGYRTYGLSRSIDLLKEHEAE